MPVRHTDTDFSTLGGGITVDRKIPLWGILSLLGMLGVQAVLIWNGQQLQAQKMETLSTQFREVAGELKEANAQLNAKTTVDSDQTLRIGELSRRLLIIESQREARR